MGSWVEVLARHGGALLFAVCLMEAVGLPLPAAVALITAGALAASGTISLGSVLLAGVSAFLVGDCLYFLLGRHTGWWLLGVLCRISTNPDACILRSAEAFYRRGRVVLVVSKFIPGLNTMAPPLAGSMRMPLGQFLFLDLAGILIYVGTYVSVGFLFRDLLAILLGTLGRAGTALEIVFGGALLAYFGYRGWLGWKARDYRSVPRVEFGDVDGPVFDVRSHGYYEEGAKRIQGSLRLEPNRLPEAAALLPEGAKIYLYCT